MKNKKNILINSALLLAGLFLGWLIFGGNSSRDSEGQISKNESKAEIQTWTCSMHPQIKLPEKGDCAICGMDLIPMTSGSSNDNPARIEMSKTAIELANIQTSKAELSKAEKEIFMQGKVEIDQRRISAQTAHFGGRIEKLFISFEGEKVYKGQKMAIIYSPQLVTAQQELHEAAKNKTVYPDLYVAAKNKLKHWKLSDKQIAEIESSKNLKKNFEVLADVSGYVTKMNISLGNHLKTGEIMFEIADLNQLWVVFDAYEKDLSFIKKGNSIDFTVSSLGDKEFTAKVKYIDPIVNSQNRTVSVRTEVNNSNSLLKPQMFVSGLLTASLSHKEDALIIPKSAIMWTGKRSVAYVRVPETGIPVFEFREIELGEPLGNYQVIIDGIEAGEEVVTNGAFSIDAAAQLNSKYSMMNPPIAKRKKKIPNYKDASAKFTTQLNPLLLEYLQLNNNLIVADADASQKNAKKTQALLKKVNSNLISGKAKKYWKKQLKIIEKEVANITNTKNIDTQRRAYNPLSTTIIEVFTSFGTKLPKVYVQHCPMANEDKGASWLSINKQIRNPYFGDMMMKCGVTEDSIWVD